MRKIVIGCAVAGMIALSPKSEAKLPGSFSTLAELPIPVPRLAAEVGLASWYGSECQNNLTASGETYDMNGLTAAHRELPLGTRIKVINLSNHRSVILRINDRGPDPLLRGRLVDVSMSAAKKLGFLEAGLTRVEVSVVSLPKEHHFPGSPLTDYLHAYNPN